MAPFSALGGQRARLYEAARKARRDERVTRDSTRQGEKRAKKGTGASARMDGV